MSRNIAKRVEASFPEGDKESVKQYLDWLRAALVDLSNNMRRTATLLVFLMGAFEFIYESPNADITVGGFHFTKGSVVLLFVPALVAYLGLQLIVYSENSAELGEVFTQAFKRWSVEAEKNDLDLFVFPSGPLFWNTGDRGFRKEFRALTDSVQDGFSTACRLILIIGGIAFEAQAYWVLFNGKSISSIILWTLSLCMTISCLSIAGAHQWEKPENR